MEHDPRKPAVCVFAASPHLDAQPSLHLEPHVARALAAALVEDACALVKGLEWAQPVLALEHANPGSRSGPMEIWSQGRGEPGERLETIFRRALEHAPSAMVVRADAPGLPVRILEEARDALRGADAVVGPAEDGGIYLLGLKRCPVGLLNQLPWGWPTTLAHLEERLRAWGFHAIFLAPWFRIERADALERLTQLIRQDRVRAPACARVLGIGAPERAGLPTPGPSAPGSA